MNSREYKNWRMSIFMRDKFFCGLCGQKGKKLNAHHIQRWADVPELRYVVSNGVSLCEECHKQVTGNEARYAAVLQDVVNKNTTNKYANLKKKKQFGKYHPRNPRLRF